MSSMEDKGVCLIPTLKMSHFQEQILPQFFQNFVLNFHPQDPGALESEVNWIEKCWLYSVEHFQVRSFLSTAALT